MRCCFWLVGVVLLLFVESSTCSGQSRIIGDPSRGVQHTILARRLLLDDPDLASINIGVIVTDRVAVLWGPVPSAEVAFRAELCMRSMVELVEVRNELFVCEQLEPIRKPLKIDISPSFLPDRTPLKEQVQPRPIIGAPGLLTGQDKVEMKKAMSLPTSIKPPVASKVQPAESLPKLGVPEPDTYAKKLPEPNDVSDTERELTASIRTFLQSKSVFGVVQFVVKDRRVFLKTSDQDTDTLHEAARGIARLPNVDGVILVDKTTPR
jgi:hypothetical protein